MKPTRLSIRIKMALSSAIDVAQSCIDADSEAYHRDYQHDLNDAAAWVSSLVTPAEWERWEEYAKRRKMFADESDRKKGRTAAD